MPISRSPRTEHPAEAGLTLVEMLVVLAIIGVMAGAVAIGIGSPTRQALPGEARRLAQRLSLASDEVLVTDQPIALDWDDRGYRFLGWTGRKWTPLATPALDAHALPAGITLSAEGAKPLPIGGDDGGASLDVTLSSGGARWRVRFDGATATAEPGA